MSLGYEPNEETISPFRRKRLLLVLSAASRPTSKIPTQLHKVSTRDTVLCDCYLNLAPHRQRDSLFNARWLTSNKNGGPGENRTPNFCVQGRSYPI
jgi:hypothetical protein